MGSAIECQSRVTSEENSEQPVPNSAKKIRISLRSGDGGKKRPGVVVPWSRNFLRL